MLLESFAILGPDPASHDTAHNTDANVLQSFPRHVPLPLFMPQTLLPSGVQTTYSTPEPARFVSFSTLSPVDGHTLYGGGLIVYDPTPATSAATAQDDQVRVCVSAPVCTCV